MRTSCPPSPGDSEESNESLVSYEHGHLGWSYGCWRARRARLAGVDRSRTIRRVLRVVRSAVTRPGRAWLSRRAARLVSAVALTTALLAAAPATPVPAAPSAKATTRKTTKPVRTTKRVTTTRRSTTTAKKTTSTAVAPQLSTEAKSVLDGYENYVVAFVAATREPERARELLPKGMTGDALARMLDIADAYVAAGEFWDGTRAQITSHPRVESLGVTQARVRDCRSVAGVVRKRTTNEAVAGSTGVDVDDLLVDLVKVDGRWVVTRTDRLNETEGKATCAASP